MKRLVRVFGVVAGLGAAIYLLRDRLVRVPDEPAPPDRFRTSSPNGEPTEPASAAAAALADDLTDINGIGPVYAERLRDAGVDSFAALASADAARLAETIDVSIEQISDWVEQARTRL